MYSCCFIHRIEIQGRSPFSFAIFTLGVSLTISLTAGGGRLVFAQEDGAPASIEVGSGYLTPALEVQLEHNDNLLFQPSDTLETTSVRTTANLNYELGTETRKLLLDWVIDAAQYDGSSADNYLDSTLTSRFQYRPTDRFFGELGGTVRDMHDFRGTGRAEGISSPLTADPDEWRSTAVEASIGYGAYQSTGRVEFEVGHISKEYTNNEEFTFVRDRDDVYAAGRFFYRIGDVTRLLLEARTTRFTYDHDEIGVPGLDSNTDRLYAGATWDPTARISGAVRVGHISKNFDDGQRDDRDALGWEAEINWRPRTYSTVTLLTARDFIETNGTGNFIEQKRLATNWEHFWRDRFSTQIGLQYALDTFDPTVREDDIFQGSFGVNYQMQRWLTLGVSYRYNERDSNDSRFDFQRNVVALSVRIVL